MAAAEPRKRSLRRRIERRGGSVEVLVEAARALEPVLAQVIDRNPSRLAQLGFKSVHLLGELGADDEGRPIGSRPSRAARSLASSS
jgi:hypothetical protein